MVLIGQVECMNLSCLRVQFSTFPSAFCLFVLSLSLFFIQRLRPIFHLTSFSISSSCTGAILCSCVCVCGCAHATDVFKMTARLGCSVPALVGRQMVTCAWTCLHAHLFSWRSFRSHFQGAASRNTPLHYTDPASRGRERPAYWDRKSLSYLDLCFSTALLVTE